MEIKLPGTEDKEQQYFDNLLARIRDIRSSESRKFRKIQNEVNPESWTQLKGLYES